MKTYIGIDLGGTNVRTAVVTEHGKVLCMRKAKSEVAKGPGHSLSIIINMVESMEGYQDCEGIGIGVPGVVDKKRGVLVVSENLKGFANFPLLETLKAYFHKPVVMDNDVNCAGLAEALFGAGKENDTVYYISISTGVGGVLVHEGKVFPGAHGYGGELCKVVVATHPSRLQPLMMKPLNNTISGTSMARYASAVYERQVAGAEEVFALAKKGDAKAQQIIQDFSADLAVLLNNIAYVCDPDVFVLGGGLMASDTLFLSQVDAYFHKLLLDGMQDIKIVKAKLQEPGLVGAALLVQKEKTVE